MIVVLALSSNPNALKNRIYYIYSFAVRVRANSSALVLAVVTIFCFIALKCSILPNSLIAYLLKLYLMFYYPQMPHRYMLKRPGLLKSYYRILRLNT